MIHFTKGEKMITAVFEGTITSAMTIDELVEKVLFLQNESAYALRQAELYSDALSARLSIVSNLMKGI